MNKTLPLSPSRNLRHAVLVCGLRVPFSDRQRPLTVPTTSFRPPFLPIHELQFRMLRHCVFTTPGPQTGRWPSGSQATRPFSPCGERSGIFSLADPLSLSPPPARPPMLGRFLVFYSLTFASRCSPFWRHKQKNPSSRRANPVGLSVLSWQSFSRLRDLVSCALRRRKT